jgi:hypothetical protein
MTGECAETPENLYHKWLNEPFSSSNLPEGKFGQRYEYMDKCCINYCKEAFIHAYNLGCKRKQISNWEEMNQK